MTRTARSWLYVSAARPEQFAKALASAADVVVLDLEDSVPDAKKSSARENVARFLRECGSRRIYVRVNSMDTDHADDDIAALAGTDFGGVRISKCETVESVTALAEQLHADTRQIEIQPLIESAKGIAAVRDLLRCPGVQRVALGEVDLCADLNLADANWLDPIRLELVIRSREADREPPVSTVHTRLDDEEALRNSTLRFRSMGFVGRSAIHPRQIPVINDAFTPTDDEIRAALKLVTAIEESSARGNAAIALDGALVDRAHERTARRTLQLAGVTKGVS